MQPTNIIKSNQVSRYKNVWKRKEALPVDFGNELIIPCYILSF